MVNSREILTGMLTVIRTHSPLGPFWKTKFSAGNLIENNIIIAQIRKGFFLLHLIRFIQLQLDFGTILFKVGKAGITKLDMVLCYPK